MLVKSHARPLDWEDLRFFCTLCRLRTLSATARDLKVTHATVARRIARLEASLGCQLLDHRASGYVPTSAGQRVLEQANAMETAALSVQGLAEQEDSSDLSGLVRINTLRSFADGFLAQRLGALSDRFPNIDLVVHGEARNVSLTYREADLVIRFAEPTDGHLIGRRLTNFSFVWLAPPALVTLATGAAPPPLIGFGDDHAHLPEARWIAETFPDHRLRVRSNSWLAQAHAAQSGAGLALVPSFLRANFPDLVAVTPPRPTPTRPIWLLARPNIAETPRVRVVFDHLAAMIAREVGP